MKQMDLATKVKQTAGAGCWVGWWGLVMLLVLKGAGAQGQGAPGLTAFAPVGGVAGTAVVLTGTDLGGATAVTFNGRAAAFTVVSATRINTTVPAGAGTGPIGVRTGGGTAVGTAAFTVPTRTLVYFGGDSNTAGGEGSFTSVGGSFVSLLTAALGSGYGTINAGTGGGTNATQAPGLAALIDAQWDRTQYAQCVCCYMVGENDNVSGVSVAQAEGYISAMKAQLDGLGVKLVVSTAIEPGGHQNRLQRAWFSDFNGWLETNALASLHAAGFCDFFANDHLNRLNYNAAPVNTPYWSLEQYGGVGGTGNGGFAFDGTHWGNLGHQEYASLLLPIIRQVATGAARPADVTPPPPTYTAFLNTAWGGTVYVVPPAGVPFEQLRCTVPNDNTVYPFGPYATGLVNMFARAGVVRVWSVAFAGHAASAVASSPVFSGLVPAPVLGSLSVAEGLPGDVMTISGSNLGGATEVRFGGGLQATIIANTATSLSVVVPAGASSGPVTVIALGGGSNALAFAVLADLTVNATRTLEGGYRNLTLTGTGAATLSGPVRVRGTLAVLAGGMLATGGYVVSGSGAFALAGQATLALGHAQGLSATGSTGAIQTTGSRTYAATAAYRYNGSVAQETGPGLPAVVSSLTVANPAGLTLTQALAVREVLALPLGDLRTGPANNLTLLSAPGQGTALVDNSGGAVLGTRNVMQRAVDILTPDNIGYHHYATPMAASSAGDLAVPDGFVPVFNDQNNYNTARTVGTVRPFPTVFGYDEGRVGSLALATDQLPFDQGYFAPASAGAPLVVGRGYTASVPNALTVAFVGAFNNAPAGSPIVLSGLARGSHAQAGWQLLGNPFPSPLDWSGVAKTGLDAAMYVYHATSRYSGYYTTFLGLPNGTTIAGSPIIDAGQGFFVRVSTAGTSGTVRFANANRVTSFAPQPAFGRTAGTAPTVALALTGAAGTDAVTLYADANATTGVDAAYDAVKLANPSGLNLAALTAAGELLAINGLPGFATAQRIALKVGVPTTGNYTLNLATLANLPATTAVVLVDALTGTSTDLRRTASYRFTAVAAAPAVGRFFLNLTPAATALATAGEGFANAVMLYPNPATARATVLVPGVAGATQVTATVLNALGQTVLARTAALPAAGTSLTLDVAGLARGVYTVRLAAGGTIAARRLVLE